MVPLLTALTKSDIVHAYWADWGFCEAIGEGEWCEEVEMGGWWEGVMMEGQNDGKR